MEKEERKEENKDKKEEKREERKEDEIKWVFGKILEIKIENYTHKVMLKIEYRDICGETAVIQINPETYNVAPFPTHSFRFAEHYHLRCLQRVYNEVAN